MKLYYDLHLHSCLSPHPACAGRGPRFFYLLRRSESAGHQGFASQNAWDAPLGALQGGRHFRLPVTEGGCFK